MPDAVPDPAVHSPYSDPGSFAPLLRALPEDIESLAAAARNVIVHYRAELPEFPDHRLPEVNSRWMRRILARDQERHETPLPEARELTERVAGCCRDHALFLVSALRERGVPARSRVGFAHYLLEGWAVDHVIVEHHDGLRWVRTDPELAAGSQGFDVRDMGAGPDTPFVSAAETWLGYRDGSIDLSRHAVFPGAEGDLTGEALVRRYVPLQLAHRFGDELLLWDAWGDEAPGAEPLADAEVDELARLLVAADADERALRTEADRILHERYARDPRLRPGREIWQFSPFGPGRERVDLEQIARDLPGARS